VCNPRKYKRDVLMQVWLESRHLATLLKWLEKEGYFVRFRSEIIRHAVEQLVGHLTETGVVEMVEFTEDAQKMLHSRFGADSNPSGRGGANLHHNLVLDSRRREGQVGGYNPGSVYRSSQDTSANAFTEEPNVVTDDIKALVKKGVEIYKGLEKEEQTSEIDRQIDRMKKNLKFDKDGVVINLPAGTGNVGEEEMEKFSREKEEREKKEREENERLKEDRKKRRRVETLQKQMDKAKEEMEELKEGIREEPSDDDIRERSYEEIVADRVKKDAEQIEKLKALDEVPTQANE